MTESATETTTDETPEEAGEVGALHPDRRFFDPFAPKHQETGAEAPAEGVVEASPVAETGSEGDNAGDGPGTPDALANEAAAKVNGTIDSVLGWVGDDRDRAAAALEAEMAGKARVMLVTRLQEKLQEEAQ